MPKIKEQEHVRIKEKSTQEGKEQITKVADEKMVTTKAEAEKTEAPKKKKNIIRVYHAQNASDGGKNRPKRPASDKKPAARPQQKPQAVKPAEPVQQKPAAEAAPKKPQAAELPSSRILRALRIKCPKTEISLVRTRRVWKRELPRASASHAGKKGASMLNHHMTRRTFVGSAAALTLALAGCSRGADGKNAPGSTETDSGLAEGGAPADGIAAGDGATMAASGSVLVAYYSATGNTEAVALTIADELGAGTFSITPVEPYTDEDLDYNDSSSRVSVEHDDSARSVELAQVAPIASMRIPQCSWAIPSGGARHPGSWTGSCWGTISPARRWCRFAHRRRRVSEAARRRSLSLPAPAAGRRACASRPTPARMKS